MEVSKVLNIMLYISLNTFRRLRLKYKNYPSERHLFFDIQKTLGGCLKLQNPHCENFRWKYI